MQAVLDKADVVLAMDEEMQAQQAAQQAQQAAQQDEPTEAAEGAEAAGGPPQPLARSDTGNLEGGGSLPPGIGGSGRMASTASQEPESPLAAAAGAPSVYLSAAPSVQLEAADAAADAAAADVAATVLLETLSDGSVQLSILLPAAAEQEGAAEAEAEEDEESEGELPPELAGGFACPQYSSIVFANQRSRRLCQQHGQRCGLFWLLRADAHAICYQLHGCRKQLQLQHTLPQATRLRLCGTWCGRRAASWRGRRLSRWVFRRVLALPPTPAAEDGASLLVGPLSTEFTC